MEINRPSEQAMKNLYKFVERVLPKYINELNKLNDKNEKRTTDKRK